MKGHELAGTARKLVAGDKGLLAMDESNPTCNKRFAKLGIPQTEAARRAYRELIVTTPGLRTCIGGAIPRRSSGYGQMSSEQGVNVHQKVVTGNWQKRTTAASLLGQPGLA